MSAHLPSQRTATKRYQANPASTYAARHREIELRDIRAKESYDRQYEEVTTILGQMNIRRKQEEAKLISDYKERERILWQRVEGVIKDEEDKVRRKLEAEEKVKREEAERVVREEERRKAEAEKRKKDEQEKALKEELLRKKKEKEAADAKQRAEEAVQKQAETVKVDQGRQEAGFSTVQEDWDTARQSLMVRDLYHHMVMRRDGPCPAARQARLCAENQSRHEPALSLVERPTCYGPQDRTTHQLRIGNKPHHNRYPSYHPRPAVAPRTTLFFPPLRTCQSPPHAG